MSFFARPPYRSEITEFIDQLKAKNEQRAGRALLWDRQLDRRALADWQRARVPQQAYVYYQPPKA